MDQRQRRINMLESELKQLYNEGPIAANGAYVSCCNDVEPTRPATTIEMQDAVLGRALRRVDYHAPNSAQLPRYQNLRDAAKAFITAIVRNCPTHTEETRSAIQGVEVTLMVANKSIALEDE